MRERGEEIKKRPQHCQSKQPRKLGRRVTREGQVLQRPATPYKAMTHTYRSTCRLRRLANVASGIACDLEGGAPDLRPPLWLASPSARWGSAAGGSSRRLKDASTHSARKDGSGADKVGVNEEQARSFADNEYFLSFPFTGSCLSVWPYTKKKDFGSGKWAHKSYIPCHKSHSKHAHATKGSRALPLSPPKSHP